MLGYAGWIPQSGADRICALKVPFCPITDGAVSQRRRPLLTGCNIPGDFAQFLYCEGFSSAASYIKFPGETWPLPTLL